MYLFLQPAIPFSSKLVKGNERPLEPGPAMGFCLQLNPFVGSKRFSWCSPDRAKCSEVILVVILLCAEQRQVNRLIVYI